MSVIQLVAVAGLIVGLVVGGVVGWICGYLSRDRMRDPRYSDLPPRQRWF